MLKTDVVRCYRPGSPQDGEPDFLEERETVRAWRDEGAGHFARNGKIFQMDATFTPAEELLGHGNLVPFSRSQKRVGDLHLRPASINYPIPALGDHRIRWHNSFMVPEQTKIEAC